MKKTGRKLKVDSDLRAGGETKLRLRSKKRVASNRIVFLGTLRRVHMKRKDGHNHPYTSGTKQRFINDRQKKTERSNYGKYRGINSQYQGNQGTSSQERDKEIENWGVIELDWEERKSTHVI